MDTCFDEIQERHSEVHRNPELASGSYNRTHSLSLTTREHEIADLAEWRMLSTG